MKWFQYLWTTGLIITSLAAIPLKAEKQTTIKLNSPPVEQSIKLKIKIGGTLAFHLRDKDQENPNIPDEYESITERPSIGYFFADGLGFSFDLFSSIPLSDDNPLCIIVGICYENTTLTNSYGSSSEQILGKDLKIININPFIGFESKLSWNSVIAYGFIGPSFKSYEGNYDQDDILWKNIYNSSTAFRIGGGIEIPKIFAQNLFLNIGLTFDFGIVERKKVEAFQSGVKVISADPIGDKNLSDNVISLKLAMGYEFNVF